MVRMRFVSRRFENSCHSCDSNCRPLSVQIIPAGFHDLPPSVVAGHPTGAAIIRTAFSRLRSLSPTSGSLVS